MNTDILTQANCDEIIDGCTNVTNTISATMHGRTPAEEVEKARKNLIEEGTGRLHLHLTGLNSVVCQDESEFACGRECGLAVADLVIWRLKGWLSDGIIDHILSEFVFEFSNLKKIYDIVEANKTIVLYKNKFWSK